MLPLPSEHARHWTLAPDVVFLNHGSFGACPRSVLERQTELRAELEREPLSFFLRGYQERLDHARERLSAVLGARPEDVAFVPNATTGVNTVLASLELAPGDELLVTDHTYAACTNAARFFVERAGARVVVAHLPFPLTASGEILEAVLAAVTARTRVAIIDTITSPTGLLLPVARIVEALAERGVDTLVDGAHAPGMVPLDLDAQGAAWFVGNCHKWLCAPKGVGVLHARADKRAALRPLVISHGAAMPPAAGDRFRLEFDWMGTDDPTPILCLPDSIDFLSGLLPGGLPALQARNRSLALQARDTLCEHLDVPAPAPDDMIAMLAAVPLPGLPPPPSHDHMAIEPLQAWLFDERGIEVPITRCSGVDGPMIRVSAQAYNSLDQYRYLARALGERVGLSG